jgi:tRNA uridine 5-carboxymethylaminomethyl modification enzyme
VAREHYDVLVIGGGHAGAEAAHAAARIGARTAMVTFKLDAIGRMSCNPAIGGIGKGQIVREIDALGGLMGLVADETGIQFRMLNRRKGPAMWAPRCQSDQALYAAAVQRHLRACPNLTLIEAGVDRIETCSPPDAAALRITGVVLSDGRQIDCAAAIVTSGTFLRAIMHTGESATAGGRVGEPAAAGLSDSLGSLGFELARLKTGTPPRLARQTIDFEALEEQHGDPVPTPFSFLTERIVRPQHCCWITNTNERIHDLIRANLDRAPMYSGQIQSTGPRYCPSIEDKVVRFADKSEHQIFLEPEGAESDRIYCNGISTSLPKDIQSEIIRSIPGLEHAHVLQWGYAVEYDYAPPEQILANLMTKRVAGLFLAGQINGTSGYEEAAGQGVMAGINAARYVADEPPIVLRRDQAYIGVMIDDLVTRGLVEPYRMFTSRAEHRLLLRYDNADTRLTELGREIGLVQSDRWDRYRNRASQVDELRNQLDQLRVDGRSLAEWLKRPEEDGARFLEPFPVLRQFHAQSDVWGSVLVEIRYAGYLDRQHRTVAESRRLEDMAIPAGWDYAQVKQLRREAIDRWGAVRPLSVGQAARVSGVHPTDVSILLVALNRLDRERFRATNEQKPPI